MKESIETISGPVRKGSRIRIVSVNCKMDPCPAFPDGIDHQALEMEGKEGTVEWIDDNDGIHGTWGGLSVIADTDTILVLEY